MSSSSSRGQAIALPPTPVTPNAPHLDHCDDDVDAPPPPHAWWWKLRELYENNIGMLFISAAQLFFTLMNISVKMLNRLENPVPILELVLVRMIITYILSILYMKLRKIPDAIWGPSEVRYLLILRGIAGFFALFAIYYTLKYLKLSDAVVLTFLIPTTTAIAGYFFLRETLSRREVFAGMLSLGGVVLIARPQAIFGAAGGDDTIDIVGSEDATNLTVSSSQRLLAVGVAMVGVAGSTGAYITLRAIGTRAHPLHSLTFFSSYSILVSAAAMIALRITPVFPTQWRWLGLLLAVGICGFIAQIFLVLGFQRETASRGSLALYVQIIFAAFFERVLFKTSPTYLSLLGMVIIIGSGAYVVITKDTATGSYKRVPQTALDIEAHELAEAPAMPVEPPSQK